MDRNCTMQYMQQSMAVALRKESVDRNPISSAAASMARVALRKESVDRNQAIVFRLQAVSGRSPQGERG